MLATAQSSAGRTWRAFHANNGYHNCHHQQDLPMMIFLSYVKMHFSYVKSKILHKWLNILHKFYVTMFTPEHSLLQRSTPLLSPGQPSHLASHQTLPATWPCQPPYLALHPTLLPPHPVCLPSRTASSAKSAKGALLHYSAVVVLLQRLCGGGASQRAL